MNKIWFDLDNSPHVPLFRPVFKELELRSLEYFVSARDFAQTKELLNYWNIDHTLVGKHAGKNKIKKILNLFERSSELKKLVKGKNTSLAVSHGSRTQLLTSKRLGIKSILMLDYEYTESIIFNYLATKILIPMFIPDKRLADAGFKLNKIIRYNGFKEELYLKDLVPDKDFRKSINISPHKIFVVIRPPSMVGNYHDPKSEKLLLKAINFFSRFEEVDVLVVNRTYKEREFIQTNSTRSSNVNFLEKPVDGLQLLFAADISVSGGGTMNRESALLGTKTYSIFTGRKPYLDEYLQEKGKLKFIEDPKEIENIEVKKYDKSLPKFENNLAAEITNILIDYAGE